MKLKSAVYSVKACQNCEDPNARAVWEASETQSPKCKHAKKKAGKRKFKIKLKRKAQKHRRSRGQDENRRTDEEKEENTGFDT